MLKFHSPKIFTACTSSMGRIIPVSRHVQRFKSHRVFTLALLAVSVCASMALLSGCTTDTTSPAKDDKKLSVVASFYTMADFASMIGGDQVEVTTLVGQGVEPHDWEPSVEDIQTLSRADLVILNGAGMESWSDSLIKSGDIPKDKFITASKNISLMSDEDEHTESGVTKDYTEQTDTDKDSHDTSAGHETAGHAHAEDHDHDKADAHTEDHDHDGSDAHTEEHDHGGVDPHVWLDPMQAKSELRVITDAFCEKMPEKRDYFEQRYTDAAQKLDELDAQYRKGLEHISTREIVVSHEAFGYLCRAYNLVQVPIQGLSADSEPDAQTMARIVDYIKENQVKTIFTEELLSPKTAEALASETGVDIMTLNPIEGISEEDAQANNGYIELMKENLDTLTKALA